MPRQTAANNQIIRTYQHNSNNTYPPQRHAAIGHHTSLPLTLTLTFTLTLTLTLALTLRSCLEHLGGLACYENLLEECAKS